MNILQLTKRTDLTGLEGVFVFASANDQITYAMTYDNLIVNISNSIGASIVAGADTQVQYNDNGVLAADANFAWDKNTQVLSISGAITATNFNGVALTAIGAATDYLDATGNYSVPPTAIAGGSPTEIQFNTAGALDATPNLVWTGLSLDASAFNSVALTAAGVATDYLNASGTYTAIATQVSGADTQVQFNNAGVFGSSASLTWNGTTLNATQFNGVALTTAGVATNYLDETGNYSVPPDVSNDPAGANTEVQFNNSGAFGASASLTWNGTTLNATQFNGVALTAAGVATNFLNETGAYTVPPANVGASSDTEILFNSGGVVTGQGHFDWDGTDMNIGKSGGSGGQLTIVSVDDIGGAILDGLNQSGANVFSVDSLGKVVALDFNGVALTTGGGAGNYLDGAGSYVALTSNVTHTGEVTGSGILTVDPTAISNKTLKAVPGGAEEVLINDAGTLKKTTTQAIADLAMSAPAEISGPIITPAQLTATADDYSPTGFSTTNMIRQDIDANNRAITGFAAPAASVNRIIYINNISTSAFDILYMHNDAGSVAANRLLLRANANKASKPNETAAFWYDHTSSRWRPYSRVG